MQKHEDLKAARTLSGMSQAQAAAKIGVRRATYNEWENGKTALSPAKYTQFLEAIGKTQADVDAYFAALPAAQQPVLRTLTEVVVTEFFHTLSRSKAEALCAAILKGHPTPAPKKIEYDRLGYPLNVPPFGAVEFSRTYFEKQNPGLDLTDALVAIEGTDYPALERVREIKRLERHYPNNKDNGHLENRARALRKWDEDMAVHFAAVAVDNAWPNAEEAAAFLEAKERKDAEVATKQEEEKARTLAQLRERKVEEEEAAKRAEDAKQARIKELADEGLC